MSSELPRTETVGCLDRLLAAGFPELQSRRSLLGFQKRPPVRTKRSNFHVVGVDGVPEKRIGLRRE